jgi:hypothetical protein
MSVNASIYIPRISAEHDEESIKYYMMINGIGVVSYVDFTPINKKPGFYENVDLDDRSVFVHFDYPRLSSDNSYYYYNSTTSGGNAEFWNTIASGKPYKLQIFPDEYWICLKNKNPVQRTMMNIHQIVENGRYLEDLIEAQTKIIQEQAKKIDKLQKNIDNIQYVFADYGVEL